MNVITDINNVHHLNTAPAKKKPAKDSRGESTAISGASALLEEAQNLASQAPEIDEARVAEIRQAIENGQLSINYERLAQKMLEFELTLFDD